MATVTSLTLAPGATPTHITVCNQDGTPLHPNDITWAIDASLTGVTQTSDATGFDFEAAAGTGDATGNAVATYTPNGVTGSLTLTVQITVTSLTFTSP